MARDPKDQKSWTQQQPTPEQQLKSLEQQQKQDASKQDQSPQSQPTGVVGQDKKPPEPVAKIAFEWRMLKHIDAEKFRDAMVAANLSEGQRMTEEEFDKVMAAGKDHEKGEQHDKGEKGEKGEKQPGKDQQDKDKNENEQPQEESREQRKGPSRRW